MFAAQSQSKLRETEGIEVGSELAETEEEEEDEYDDDDGDEELSEHLFVSGDEG